MVNDRLMTAMVIVIVTFAVPFIMARVVWVFKVTWFVAIADYSLVVTAPEAGILCPVSVVVEPGAGIVYNDFISMVNIKIMVAWW